MRVLTFRINTTVPAVSRVFEIVTENNHSDKCEFARVAT